MESKCKICGKVKILTQNHTPSGKMFTGIICAECFRNLSENAKKHFWAVLDRIDDSSQFLAEFNQETAVSLDKPVEDEHAGMVYNPLDGKWRWL